MLLCFQGSRQEGENTPEEAARHRTLPERINQEAADRAKRQVENQSKRKLVTPHNLRSLSLSLSLSAFFSLLFSITLFHFLLTYVLHFPHSFLYNSLSHTFDLCSLSISLTLFSITLFHFLLTYILSLSLNSFSFSCFYNSLSLTFDLCSLSLFLTLLYNSLSHTHFITLSISIFLSQSDFIWTWWKRYVCSASRIYYHIL